MTRGRWLTPDETSDSNIARCLSIPPNLQPMVNFALEQLTYAENWEEDGDMSVADCVSAMRDVLSTYYESGCGVDQVFAQEVFWGGGAMRVTAGSALAFVTSGFGWGGGYYWHSTPAVNDRSYITAVLEAGEYELAVVHEKRGSAGILHVLIDGTDEGTIDFYNNSLQNAVKSTLGGITIPESGLHEVAFLMSTKNASSSNYRREIYSCHLYRTGA